MSKKAGLHKKHKTDNNEKTVLSDKNRDWSNLVAIHAVENGKTTIYRVPKSRVKRKIELLGESYRTHGKYVE